MIELNERERAIALAVLRKYVHDRMLFRTISHVLDGDQHFDFRGTNAFRTNEELFYQLVYFLGVPSKTKSLLFLSDNVCSVATKVKDLEMDQRAEIALEALLEKLNSEKP